MVRVIEVESQATEDHYEWQGLPECLELTKDEEWLLRHLDKFCRRPCEESSLMIPLDKWPEGEKMEEGVALLMGQLDGPNINDLATHLNHLGLIGSRPGTLQEASDTNYRGMVINLWITAAGRQFVRRLDNPDVVEQITGWWRRHLITAWSIVVVVALSLLVGLVADVLSILSTLGIITQTGT